MRANTESEPDCTGKCRCSQRFLSVAKSSISSGDKSCGCEVVKRMRRKPSIASTRREQLGKAQLAGRELAVGINVLAEQHHFFDALARQRFDFGENLVARPAHFAAAHMGHDAEAADLVAALHDRHEGLGAVRLGCAVRRLPCTPDRGKKRSPPAAPGYVSTCSIISGSL